MGPQSAATPRQRLSFTEIALSRGTVTFMIRIAQLRLSDPRFRPSPVCTLQSRNSAVGG